MDDDSYFSFADVTTLLRLKMALVSKEMHGCQEFSRFI